MINMKSRIPSRDDGGDDSHERHDGHDHEHGHHEHPHPIPLPQAGEGKAIASGRVLWKSLEELTGTAEFRQWLDREFPVQASEWDDPEGRRRFLKLMGASLALAGLAACTRQPTETIVPYVKAPEDLVPGRPLFYATAVKHDGYAKGVLVESHMGRPTKVEGNPEHPASLGATDVFGQAEILSLYDPDRSQTLKLRGEVRPWTAFVEAMRTAVGAQKASGGAGIRILTETVTSPTLAAELEALQGELPQLRWHVYEPTGREQSRAGAVQAFGEPVDVRYRLDAADVIVSLDADFLGEGASNLALIRAFSSRRRASGTASGMNRLYVVESTPSLTGGAADHRLPVKPSEIEGLARGLAAALEMPVEAQPESGRRGAWLQAMAKDLRQHAGRSVVLAGEGQPPIVHALAHGINDVLGNVGKTVSYAKPVDRGAAYDQSLRALVEDMKAGKVSLLLIVGSNPVYTAPVDLGFTDALEKVETRVHLGLYEDETAARCHWHVPAAHDFETWGDARAADGTITIQQPLIEPLYGGKNALEVLATLGARPQRSAHDTVREHWRTRLPAADLEKAWRRALHDGIVAGSEEPEQRVAFRKQSVAGPVPRPSGPGLELIFRPDPTIHDGRYANNGWLQELPKPLTKLTWDNAALISPKLADTLQVKTGDEVRLKYEGRTVIAAAYVMPGQADEAVTIHLGYGRTRAGRVGDGAGFSAYALRTSARPWYGPGLQIEKSGGHVTLALTQDHWSMEGRGIVRQIAVRTYEEGAEAVAEAVRGQGHGEDPKPEESLYPPFKYEGHAWGMSIDLNACVGCNACVVACQSENNIPVVGREQVAKGREMHWLRVDRYFSGDPARSETIDAHFAPIPCMQCENAPCEVVCPVAATVHSDEGLNDMVYNRCVGTKYCSNNCPYKVRRFNFHLYQDWDTPSLKLMRNPDVTVRSRGVMEKCTYCVQRINAARINARNDGDRKIKDGEIRTACQQACPSQAIVFGDINDHESAVSQAKGDRDPRSYSLLGELNTRPRTTYLAAVRNPNPEMPADAAHEASHHG
jgi:MoCo/4Fe-4S cofactor protein with predicted Tat translocation signal